VNTKRNKIVQKQKKILNNTNRTECKTTRLNAVYYKGRYRYLSRIKNEYYSVAFQIKFSSLLRTSKNRWMLSLGDGWWQ